MKERKEILARIAVQRKESGPVAFDIDMNKSPSGKAPIKERKEKREVSLTEISMK